MQRVYLAENTVYQFRIYDTGVVDFLDGTASSRIISILHKGNMEGSLFANDEINGTWGEEVSVSLPSFPADQNGVISIKYTPLGLEIWTDAQAGVFSRIKKLNFKKIRFMRLFNAECIGGNPQSGIVTEDAARAEIAEHIILRRLDQLENTLVKQKK